MRSNQNYCYIPWTTDWLMGHTNSPSNPKNANKRPGDISDISFWIKVFKRSRVSFFRNLTWHQQRPMPLAQEIRLYQGIIWGWWRWIIPYIVMPYGPYDIGGVGTLPFPWRVDQRLYSAKISEFPTGRWSEAGKPLGTESTMRMKCGLHSWWFCWGESRN